jgi:hypothetical protein
MSGEASWRSRMARVRRNRVVLAVVATVKPLRRRHCVNRRGAVNFAEVTEARRNSSPGRARHRPSNHRAGKAWSRLPCVSPVHACAISSHGGCYGCQPAPGLPCALSLRRGEARSIARANLPRDCARVSATRMRIDLPFEPPLRASLASMMRRHRWRWSSLAESALMRAQHAGVTI